MALRLRPLAAGAIMVAAVAAAGSWLVGRSPAAPSLAPDDPAVVAQGAEIYAAHCASCHGADLEGQPDWRQRLPNGRLPAPPHDQTGHTWHHSDDQLFAMTKHGMEPFAPPGYESDMPAYADVLTDAEIAAVLSFIKSTWPEAVRRRHDAINAAQQSR